MKSQKTLEQCGQTEKIKSRLKEPADLLIPEFPWHECDCGRMNENETLDKMGKIGHHWAPCLKLPSGNVWALLKQVKRLN